MDRPLPPLGQYVPDLLISLDANYTGHSPGIDPKTAAARLLDDYMNDRTARTWHGLARHPT